mgnify:CR=1 FL=1
MILPLDEIGQFPISLIIIAIIINGIYNHSIYKFIVIFLFEKGMTNRQRREWRKEKYFKRKTMRYIRATIKSLPEQDFSPNIEKYHLADVVSIVVSIITFAIVSMTYYLTREINWAVIVTFAIHEATTIATAIFYSSHITSRDKKEDLLASFGESLHLNNAE